MSVAKKAIDSSLRRILNYTAEIIMSIILLVILCIPLMFTIPMWFQYVVLGAPRFNLSLDPVIWFGMDGALWVTLFLGLVSFGISYVYILKMHPGISSASDKVSDAELSLEADEDSLEEIEDEDIPSEELIEDEDIPLEDQEDEDTPVSDIDEEILEEDETEDEE